MNKIVWLIALVIVASLTLFTIRVWIVSDLLSPTRDPASSGISTFSQERETKLPVAVLKLKCICRCIGYASKIVNNPPWWFRNRRPDRQPLS